MREDEAYGNSRLSGRPVVLSYADGKIVDPSISIPIAHPYPIAVATAIKTIDIFVSPFTLAKFYLSSTDGRCKGSNVGRRCACGS